MKQMKRSEAMKKIEACLGGIAPLANPITASGLLNVLEAFGLAISKKLVTIVIFRIVIFPSSRGLLFFS